MKTNYIEPVFWILIKYSKTKWNEKNFLKEKIREVVQLSKAENVFNLIIYYLLSVSVMMH